MGHFHCVKSVQIRSFSWFLFSRISTECGDLRGKSLCSVRIRENTDQKKLRIWTPFTQCFLDYSTPTIRNMYLEILSKMNWREIWCNVFSWRHFQGVNLHQNLIKNYSLFFGGVTQLIKKTFNHYIHEKWFDMCLVFENISFCVHRKIKFILLWFVSVVKTTEKLEKLRKMVCSMIFGDIKCMQMTSFSYHV